MTKFLTAGLIFLTGAFCSFGANAGQPLHLNNIHLSKGQTVASTFPGAPHNKQTINRANSSVADTLRNYSSADVPGIYILDPSGGQGYISGNGYVVSNDTAYPFAAVGEVFSTPSANLYAASALVNFGYTTINAADSNIRVKAYLYNAPGSQSQSTDPGPPLDSASVTLRSIVTNGGYTKFTFPHKVTLPGPSFFIAVNLPQKAGDTIVILTNELGASDGNGWLDIPSAGGWFSYYDLVGQTLGTYIAVTLGGAGCPAPTIIALGPDSVCQGGAVVLQTSGGSSYLWSSGQTTQGIAAYDSGYYTVTVTNGACIVASGPFLVKVNPIPSAEITASGPTTFCKGGSVKLTAGLEYSYVWSNGKTTRSITVKTSGNYTVTITDAHGCSNYSSALKVTAELIPVAKITASGVCSDTLTANKITGAKYKWSDGATAISIFAPAAGTYTVTVTNKYQCSASASDVVAACHAKETGGNQVADKTSLSSPPAGNVLLQASVYPNPLSGQFHVKVESSNAGNVEVRIFDITGKLVEEQLNVPTTTEIVCGNGYGNGVYIVQITQGGNTRVLRIIKSE